MDWTNLIIGILGSTNIISILLLIKNWKTDKIKQNADSKITEFKATQEIVNIYKNMYTDVKDNYEYRLSEAFKEIELLNYKVTDLQKFKCERENCENREQ